VNRALLAAVVLACVTACGSTVQVTGQVADAGPAGSLDGGLTGVPSSSAAAPGESPSSSDVRPGSVTPPGTVVVRPSTPAGPSRVTVRAPLTIGVLYGDNGAANAALGVATDASNSPKSIMSALIAAVNRSGGLAGRRLTAVYDAVDAQSSDYSTQANAACSYFSEDHPVPVVLDLAYGNKFGMASCLAKHGIVDVGIRTSDTVGDNGVSLFAAPSWMSSTRRYPAVLSGLHATGYLTSKNKIGVLLEDCPDLQRAYQQAVVPAISRLGLVLTDTEHLGCATGFTSAGPASASVQSAALRFRSSGVDRILMVSDFEQVTLLLIANYAESQRWRPGFLLTSQAQTEVMRANIASGQWPQLHGVGWSPGLDIDDPHQPLPAVDRRCLDQIKQGGVAVSGWQNTYVATTECTSLFFLGAALQLSNGDAHGSAVMAAVDRLGAGFSAPGIVAGRTAFGPRRHDGPAADAPFAFVASCSCLRYVGTVAAAP
jgi:hypothetical protein